MALKFVILTRLGLGRQDDAFYREHIDLLRMTLAVSLRAQTDKDFTLAVAIDARAPSWVERELHSVLPQESMEVWRRDPLEVGLNPVDRSRLIEMGAGAPLITARIDDDDLLARSYVEEVRSRLANRPAPTYLSFFSGLYVSSNAAVERERPWNAMGLACLSPPDLSHHAFRYNHTRTEKLATADGAGVLPILTSRPMWARTVRPTSDSARGSRSAETQRTRVDLTSFGANWLDTRRLLLRLKWEEQRPTQSVGVTTKVALPRLHMKLQILRQISALKKLDPYPTDQIEALAAAMYAL